MNNKMRLVWAMLAGLAILLASCRSKAEPTPDPKAVFTAAAETANAMMTEMAAITPTAKPSDTPTITPTATPITPTATLTLTPVALAGTLADRAEFVADVTVPDGTNYAGGSAFTKTWRLKNIGTSTWTTAYSLVFQSGTQMAGPASTPLQGDVPPGQTVDISVNLTAPSTVGQYTGFWILRNPLGKNFGVGVNADLPIYVLINVTSAGTPAATSTATLSASATTAVATGTGTVSATTAAAGGDIISKVSLSVDNPNFTGACPHIFVFPVQLVLNKAATLTFSLEAVSNTPGFTFNLPSPTTAEFDAGTHNLNYELTINNSVSGYARVHVTSPVDVVSNQVSFVLTCQ